MAIQVRSQLFNEGTLLMMGRLIPNVTLCSKYKAEMKGSMARLCRP